MVIVFDFVRKHLNPETMLFAAFELVGFPTPYPLFLPCFILKRKQYILHLFESVKIAYCFESQCPRAEQGNSDAHESLTR